ncbi:MAG TPA: DUF3276 family protein [Bacteroidia bacterium]|jgi:hypothetical protein|nr:DUF3276 family protein [Bacteroidia bacterium]MBP7259892.1 DUF3276 family protein [Bacteroidia bacterium]MBP9179961.1 DUF3276 family protein [Bacteroidia bacterium]MBP9723469.1 DUF3276 family protein [Bacteroidia bacterium]HLP33276.1 DUF3276 family protein [Bacteroidia bacterium]
MDDFNKNDRQEIYSKKIRAGKRTYFFDVKSTRGNDYFLTITESTKKFEDGNYVKHKIFLYKEDFSKFVDALNETIGHIKTELMPEYDFEEFNRRSASQQSGSGFEDEQ